MKIYNRFTKELIGEFALEDLFRANLSEADLSEANLSGADLSEANLSEANLSEANLSGADLSEADLSRADLSEANLSGADLSEANLFEANLSGANLSESIGLINPIEYLEQNFKKTCSGYIVYKTFGKFKPSPGKWIIEPGSIIEEVVNFDRCIECACGINVATLDWIKTNCNHIKIYKCLIRWKWLAGVCVPYNTDGKIRTSKLEILEEVKV